MAMYHLAVADEARTGVPAAVTTAQAALESDYGRGVPIDLVDGRYSYNLFGIKGEGPAGSVSVWTHEEINGKMVKVVERLP